MKINKSIMNWDWYADSATVHLLIHLVINAHTTDSEWMGLTIKRGQIPVSLRLLAVATGISFKKVRSRLEVLTDSGLILKDTNNQRTIVTIVDYEAYFDDGLDTTQKGKQKTTKKGKSKREKKKKVDKDVLIPEPQYKNLSKFGEYILPESYKPYVEDWLQYKTEKKDKYTPMGFKKLCTRLQKKYGEDIGSLKNDIDVSIANNWKGIHKANNFNTSNYNTKGGNGIKNRNRTTTTIDIRDEFNNDLFGD